VSETAIVEVDEGMESFASGEVEMQEIVDGGAQVARAAI